MAQMIQMKRQRLKLSESGFTGLEDEQDKGKGKSIRRHVPAGVSRDGADGTDEKAKAKTV